MNKNKISFFLILFILFSSEMYSQTKFQRYVSASGGIKVTGSSNQISGTLGQIIPGKTESIQNKVYGGFWYAYSSLTGVENQEQIPLQFQLFQNFPNPFNPVTKIRYELPEELSTTLKIFNMLGEEIAVLVNNIQSPGRYEVEWNAANSASGFYICRIEAGKNVSVRKLILLK